MDFGSKIKLLRESYNLSQTSLAALLNVDRHYLSRVEKGISDPSLDFLRGVSQYFNVDVNTLIGVQKNESSSEEKINKIIESCRHLLDTDLDLLIRIISVLRKEFVKKK